MSTVQSPASSKVYSDQLSLKSTDDEDFLNMVPLSKSPSSNTNSLNTYNLNTNNLNNLNLNNLNTYNLTPAYLKPSVSSTCASIASSDVDYQNDYLNVSSYPSRPLSRSSNTSGMSITATKDGIEGKRLHRHNASNYSFLLSSMFGNNYGSQAYSQSPNIDDDSISTVSSDHSPTSHPPNIPTAPPITLKEKINLLKTGSVQRSKAASNLLQHDFEDQNALYYTSSVTSSTSSEHGNDFTENSPSDIRGEDNMAHRDDTNISLSYGDSA